MDIQGLQALLQVGAGITANGILFMAWMLERQNVQRERARGDRLEDKLLTTLDRRELQSDKE